MTLRKALSTFAFAAILAGLSIPVFARSDSGDARNLSDQGTRMTHMGRAMMGRGCSEMMQSINNGGDGRPNSQWQKHPPSNVTPD